MILAISARSQRVRSKRGPVTGSATKKSSLGATRKLDCFASLAMTAVADDERLR
jgi:hypothetical protein